MKKFILIAMMGLMSMATFAQSTIGVTAQKETGAAGNYGIGLQYGYQIGSINIAPSVSYSFEKTAGTGEDSYKYGQLGVNLDFQYLYKIQKITVYPLIGANFTNLSQDGDFGIDGAQRFGLNVGGGVRYSIANNVIGTLETKHRYLFKNGDSDAVNAAVVSLGLLYSF
jgi:opacity protein-like surface antigen